MKAKPMIKLSCVLMTLVISAPLFSQQWSDPILIANGDTPDIDIDPITGNVYVLSMKNGVTLTKLDPNGTVLEKESVPGAESDEGGGHFGASVAVDSRGYPHVCYRFYEEPDEDGTPLYTVFYVKKTAQGWQDRIRLSQNVRRGYVVRIDMDENDVAHIAHGFIYDDIFGHIRYFRIINNRIDKQEVLGLDYPYIYRGDDRLEITTSPGGKVYIVSGVPNPKGPVYYLVSKDGGENFSNFGDIHSNECNYLSRNGSPDIAIDSIGNVHICYGFSEDLTRNEEPSVRYTRFENDRQVRDLSETPQGYLSGWEKAGMGLGSIACSDNGQVIVLAFLQQPGGLLYTTISQDTGATWEQPVEIVVASGSHEGRNKQFVRSRGNKFYLVYPHNYNVYLRILTVPIYVPPVADAGGPYTAEEGASITFNGSNSYDPDGMIVKYEWDWQNDGVYDATTTTSNYNYAYSDDFTGQVRLRVTDDGGKTNTDLANVSITNVNPTAHAGGPYPGLPNENIQCQGSATDPGTEDVLTYEWDLDFDGIFETIGQNVYVKFLKGGIYQIVLRVSDDDGGVGLDTTTVNILSEPPVVTQIPPQTVDEGTPFDTINLNDYVSDPDNSDAEITWEVHGNTNLAVNIDANRVATVTPVNEDWYGSETLTFIAIDPSQLNDSTSTIFTINNVNDPPVVLPIGDQTTDEDNSFDPINLDEYITDSDNTVEEISWLVTDNVNLDYEITNRILTVFPLTADWSGREVLSIIATDLGGLSDTAKVLFTVNPVNDPPEVTKIADQQKYVGGDYAPINLDDYVSDPDHSDEEITWSYRGNTNLLVNITNRIAIITRSDSNWIGSETIVFIATDPLGAADSTRAVFSSNERDKPPVVTPIPDQKILEGQSFQPIYLDGYVTDPDHDDTKITWHIYGHQELIVTIENRVVKIKTPNEDWNGMEVINFKAVDPTGLADSSLTLFTVFPVNDPPELAPFPEFQILEDDTLKWSLAYLRSRVTDPDNDSTDFKFHISNNVHLSWLTNMQKEQIWIFGPRNWYGAETITVTVFDGSGGSDAKPCKISVNNVPDMPMPFSIIYPNGHVFLATGDTIHFSWYAAIDPEGGQPMYQLNISDNESFSHVIDQYNNLLDTSFAYVPQTSLEKGMYYWKVIAFNGVGLTASDVGRFRISITAIFENEPDAIPSDYALMQNYPNPFNPETWIVYQLPKKSFVILEIYNSLGQRVAILEEGQKYPGTHKIRWNPVNASGEKLPSGIYICRLKAEGRSFDIKMVLLQ
jgi:hypothetical protein